MRYSPQLGGKDISCREKIKIVRDSGILQYSSQLELAGKR
jgi:hypothetical protein